MKNNLEKYRWKVLNREQGTGRCILSDEADANYEAARYFRKYEEFPNWNTQGGAFGTKNYFF